MGTAGFLGGLAGSQKKDDSGNKVDNSEVDKMVQKAAADLKKKIMGRKKQE